MQIESHISNEGDILICSYLSSISISQLALNSHEDELQDFEES